jgi:hypothetical protein
MNMDKMRFNYNRNTYQHEPLNVQEKAYELLSTYNNRDDFINIMKHIDREIMGDDLLSDVEPEEEPVKPINHIKYQRSNTTNMIPTYEQSKIPTRMRNESPGHALKKIHKKYTDVHANSKYYYPDECNVSENDLEPSQWNDRSNRNNYYNRAESYDEDNYYKDINNYRPRKGLYN